MTKHMRSDPREGDIAVFESHKAFNGTYAAQIFYDVVPPLRAGGAQLFVVSTEDLDKDLHERKFFRYISAAERMLLQGHPAAKSSMLNSTMGRHAAGNAYAVPMVGAVAAPMLKQVGLYQPKHLSLKDMVAAIGYSAAT